MPTEPTVMAASREDGHLATASSFYPSLSANCLFLLCFVLAAFSAISCHLFQKIGQNPPPIKHIAQKTFESSDRCEANRENEKDVCFSVLRQRERERERGIIGGGSAGNRLISKPTPDAGTALCLNKSLWYLCFMYCVVLCCNL